MPELRLDMPDVSVFRLAYDMLDLASAGAMHSVLTSAFSAIVGSP